MIDVPGRFPLFKSSRPALIAAVRSDALYSLLPHVTVPEGKERLAMEAAVATVAARSATTICLNISEWRGREE